MEKLNELLEKDLAARLPHRVKCKISDDKEFPQDKTIVEELTPSGYKAFVDTLNCSAAKPFFVKPYLRPLSSMTEEEYHELGVIAHGCDYVLYFSCGPVRCNAKFKTYNLEVIDWLNAHHFDYRKLIPMGLALEAPVDMYNK